MFNYKCLKLYKITTYGVKYHLMGSNFSYACYMFILKCVVCAFFLGHVLFPPVISYMFSTTLNVYSKSNFLLSYRVIIFHVEKYLLIKKKFT